MWLLKRSSFNGLAAFVSSCCQEGKRGSSGRWTVRCISVVPHRWLHEKFLSRLANALLLVEFDLHSLHRVADALIACRNRFLWMDEIQENYSGRSSTLLWGGARKYIAICHFYSLFNFLLSFNSVCPGVSPRAQRSGTDSTVRKRSIWIAILLRKSVSETRSL